ncbi:family 16 glycosylhydrolase [Reichenbachiella versicolor]|uniref:family 16 glycosylhydrolase n=1 Tax=Reichenbachiella versicolor TaxID=1821036 RepID=UPI000D6EAAE9|nr:family 16 glycosylhydrolase [Reichenbachiella versicolor]
MKGQILKSWATITWIVFGLIFTQEVYAKKRKQPLPYTDPKNTGEWVLNTDVSDEFNSKKIDEDQWYIVGKFKNGKPYYKHPDTPNKKVWKGRAPSQFSGRNYRLEDGKLKLMVKWEPDFPFSDEIPQPVFGDPMPYKDITTACFIARKAFKYGYIEIKSKAADAEITSGFWSMGKGLEFDFFEMYGDGRQVGKEHLDSQMWWSIRDWKQLRGKPSYTVKKDMGFRGAEKFHVYGIEWSKDGIKYYIDGKLFSSVTPNEATAWAKENRDVSKGYDGYVATSEINLWLDLEIFPWHGIPQSKEDLTLNGTSEQKAGGYMDFEIEYIRVWQKK